MVKDLLVVLDEAGERAAPYAIALATRFGAHVTALSLSPANPIETLATEERATAVKDRFVEQARRADLAVQGLTVCGTTAATEELLIEVARLRDLVVIEQRDRDRPKPADRYIEQLLLHTGRPTLVVPYIYQRLAAFERVTVAWDGSATAARALADAIPFLQHASRVEILSVETRNVPADSVREERIVHHLARHRIEAQAQSISSTLSVTDTLLSYLADSGCDLLVMGAYGHSRLRERILGGASRDILYTMTVPVLMSH